MESNCYISRDDMILRMVTDQFEKEFLTKMGFDPESDEGLVFAYRAIRALLELIDTNIPHYEFVRIRKGPNDDGRSEI